jgi:hypothetical protein
MTTRPRSSRSAGPGSSHGSVVDAIAGAVAAATGARGQSPLPVLDPATSQHGGFVSGRDRTVSSPGSSPGVRIAVQGPACALDASERARVAAGRTRFCATAAYRVSCGLRGTPESCCAASWPAAMGHVTSIDARATAAGTPRAHRSQDGQRLDRLAHIPAAPQIAPSALPQRGRSARMAGASGGAYAARRRRPRPGTRRRGHPQSGPSPALVRQGRLDRNFSAASQADFTSRGPAAGLFSAP